jgi:hypothetical protein
VITENTFNKKFVNTMATITTNETIVENLTEAIIGNLTAGEIFSNVTTTATSGGDHLIP